MGNSPFGSSDESKEELSQLIQLMGALDLYATGPQHMHLSSDAVEYRLCNMLRNVVLHAGADLPFEQQLDQLKDEFRQYCSALLGREPATRYEVR